MHVGLCVLLRRALVVARRPLHDPEQLAAAACGQRRVSRAPGSSAIARRGTRCVAELEGGLLVLAPHAAAITPSTASVGSLSPSHAASVGASGRIASLTALALVGQRVQRA